MFCRTTDCIRWLGILIVAIMAAEAQGQGYGSNAKVITWQPATTSGETFVGILGEIARPGVYRMEPDSLSLQSIIRRSGGMTDEASGTIRVVRQDRIVENVFFTPQANSPLLAGDLLVVESKHTQAAISRLYDADPRIQAMPANQGGPAKVREPSGVQVAFVNVLDRPVIVKVKHENARLAHVVQMLDQPIELAQSVRVIGPERLLSQTAASQPIEASIADGSVLVFPRNAINRSKLPILPIPYDSEIASGAFPSLIGGPSGQSTELRNVGQLPPMMARGSTDAKPFIQAPANIDHATVPAAIPDPNPVSPPSTEQLEIPPPTQTPLVSTPSRIATIPFSGDRRITSSSKQTMIGDDVPTEPAPINPPREPSKSASDLPRVKEKAPKVPLDEEILDDIDPETPHVKKGTLITLGQMSGIAACVGLLIGVALLTRRYVDQRGSHQTRPENQGSVYGEIHSAMTQQAAAATQFAQEILVAPVVDHAAAIDSTSEKQPEQPQSITLASATQWFDKLLGNQLPISEEAAEFPAVIALQGRIVPPPVFRVDQASHPLTDGPHFAASQPAAAGHRENPAESSAIPEQTFDEFDSPHQGNPGKPHFMRRRPGENTVAAMAASAARSKSPIPSAPLPSDTPVTDALRHLQGDQS